MLILGIIAGMSVYPHIDLKYWMTSLVVITGMALIFKDKVTQTILIFISFFALGATLTTRSLESMQIAYPDTEISYQAVIMSKPQVKGKTIKMDLMIFYQDKNIKTKASILRDTVENRYLSLQIGDGITASSRLEIPQRFYAGSNFDYRQWMLCHGFQAQTFIYYRNWRKTTVSLKSLSILERAELSALRMKGRLIRNIQSDADNQASAVISAMVLGDKESLSKKTKEEYSISGSSHVLALSGLHLGIIFSILTFLFGRKKGGVAGTIVTLSTVWAYTILVGMMPSVVRSAMMITILAFTQMLNRNIISLNSISLAAIMMLIYNPLNLYDVGFQMSFTAVLSILIYYKPLYSLINQKTLFEHRIFKYVWGASIVSISAQILTAPIVAYYFGRFSCYSILTSFIAIPATTIIIYLYIIGLMVSPIAIINNMIQLILGKIAEWLNHFIAWAASLPGASIENIKINLLQLIMIYVVAAGVTYLFFKFRKLYSKTSSIPFSST